MSIFIYKKYEHTNKKKKKRFFFRLYVIFSNTFLSSLYIYFYSFYIYFSTNIVNIKSFSMSNISKDNIIP
jgi:cell division septal protein FtsQ